MRGFLVFLWLVFAMPLAAMAQTDERDALTAFLEDNLSSEDRKVTVTGFRGAFSSRAEMDELTVADSEGVWLTLTGIVLDWSRASLLRGVINIDELTAQEVIVARAPISAPTTPAPEASGFSLPDLPVSVSVKKLEAARIVLGETLLGQEVEGAISAAIELSGGDGSVNLQATRGGGGPEGHVKLIASYSNATGQTEIDLDAAEAAGGVAVTLLNVPGRPDSALKIKGSGPLDDFAAEVSLATAGQMRLQGAIVLQGAADGAQMFRADLGGDPAPLFLPDYAEFFGSDIRFKAEGQRGAAGEIDLSALSLATRALSLNGSLQIAADGLPQQISLTGHLGLADGTPVLLPLSGEVKTRVQAADLQFDFDASKGDGWSGFAAVTGLDRSDIALNRVTLNGVGQIDRRTGQADGPVIDANLTFETTGLAPADPALAAALGVDVTGNAALTWQPSGEGLRITGLSLNGAGYGVDLSATIGDLAGGFPLNGRVEARYDDLAQLSGLAGRPLAGGAVISASGAGSVLGGDFDVTAQIGGNGLAMGLAEVDGLLKGRSTIAISAKRDATGTVLRNLDLNAGQLQVTAQGTVATAGSDLTAKVLFGDLSVMGAAYSGALQADARLNGTPEKGNLTLEGIGTKLKIGQKQADELLNGQSQLSLDVAMSGGRFDIQTLNIRNPQLTASANGYYADSGSDLNATFALADLGPLGPGYAGALNAVAGFSGTPEKGNLTLEGIGTDLKIGQAQADAVFAGQSRLALDFAIDGGRFDIQTLTVSNPQITASANGHYAETGSDLSAKVAFADIGPLGAGYKGGLSAVLHATGTATNGQLELTGEGKNLAIGQGDADKLLAGVSQVTARVNINDKRLEIESANVSNPQITLSLSGSVTETMRQISLDGNLVNVALLVPGFPGALQLSGSATEDENGFALDLTGTGPGGVDARVLGRIATDMTRADLTVKGVAQAALANPFLGSRSVSGQTRFDLRLNGPLALSSLSGQVSLGEGRLSDPALPLGLQNITATAQLGGNAVQLNLSADATSGGRITTSGSIGLSAPNDGNLTIGLAGLELRNPDLFKTLLNGSVTVVGPLTGGALIAGNIQVGDTELLVPSTGLGGSGAIADLRHVNEPADVRRTRANAGLISTDTAAGSASSRPFRLDIQINAPQRIFLRGRGLDAELGGRLAVRGNTDAIIPSGAINLIRGRLDILGKRLDLDQAKLELQGKFIPYLTVLASNQGDGVTSYVEISGPADEPVVRFYSSPDLPQEEVLAQLLFGRDITKISALQALQLASAVATLAGKGGDGIIGNLRKSFGLDDLDVTTDAEGNSAVKAGKYISRRIYSEVQVDQNGQSQINLNLDLTKSTKLRGSVDSEGQTGIGIYVERDY
jgi:translocation and assembly module TamB